MPFSRKTLEYLAENQMRDSRAWYNEHKDVQKSCVTQPFTELLDSLRPTLEQLDARLDCSRWRISRLCRDARYNRGGFLYRDNVWCTISRTGEVDSGQPGVFIDFSPRGFEFGCGCYRMTTDCLAILRKMILEGDPIFQAALESLEAQELFELRGESYKRDHYPDQPERLSSWLNRRNIYFSHISEDFELFYSDRLSAFMAEGIRSMKDIWRLLAHIADEDVRQRRESGKLQ